MLMNLSAKTDPELLKKIEALAKIGPSAADLHAQRVSFIVSAVSDEKTKITPEMVERELERLSGSHA